MPSKVNPQVIDAITTPHVKVLGDAPAVAVDTVLSSLSQTVSLAMINATTAQLGMLNINTAITGVTSKKIMDLMK